MLAIIGGTGLYKVDALEVISETEVDTPFGKPSAPVMRARYEDKEVLFLPRHGSGHSLLPHEINYRANIFALKKSGARMVLGFSAVGSLREEIPPGDFAIPEQYFDRTRGNRNQTFFGEGVAAHISTAVPTCPDMTAWVADTAKSLNIPLHTGKTYACVEGPRLGTRAESHFMRQVGCDLVGMTNIPEVFLAREAQLCYATIGISTDYDCWLDDPEHHVSVADVIERFGASLEKAKSLLLELLKSPLPEIDEEYRQALKMAVLTPDEAISPEKLEMLAVLRV